MDKPKYLDSVRVIQIGLSWRERLERWTVAVHRKATIERLRHLREELERDMEPEPWTNLEAPIVLFLSDVCSALTLNKDEQAHILGQRGQQALANILDCRVAPCFHDLPHERQARASAHVRRHGAISLSAYRQLCPDWSDETLRLDLVDLVERGLLTKNGDKKGTYYTGIA